MPRRLCTSRVSTLSAATPIGARVRVAERRTETWRAHQSPGRLLAVRTHLPSLCPTLFAATAQKAMPDDILCVILDSMAPPANEAAYNKLMSLLTDNNSACRID